MKDIYNIAKAQAQLPKLVQQSQRGRPIPICKRDETVAYLVSRSHFEAIVETLEIMANRAAMKAIRSARANKLTFFPIDSLDEDEG